MTKEELDQLITEALEDDYFEGAVELVLQHLNCTRDEAVDRVEAVLNDSKQR